MLNIASRNNRKILETAESSIVKLLATDQSTKEKLVNKSEEAYTLVSHLVADIQSSVEHGDVLPEKELHELNQLGMMIRHFHNKKEFSKNIETLSSASILDRLLKKLRESQ